MKKNLISFILAYSLIACQTTTSIKNDRPIPQPGAQKLGFEKRGQHFAIASQGKDSSQVGLNVLKNGGSVVDAAIAVSFALAVERPQSTGLGGGGFLIYYQAKTKKIVVLDFRDRAPSKSKKTMFLDAAGNPMPDASTTGGLAIAVPGMVEGMRTLHQLVHSKTPFSQLVHPATLLAQNGITVSSHLAHAIQDEKTDMLQDELAKRIFFKSGDQALQAGDQLLQPELANTLAMLEKSPRSFYSGAISKDILVTLKAHHAILSAQDLAHYRTKQRKPLRGSFQVAGQSYELISMPPPSSGGIHILQFLKMMSLLKLNEKPRFDLTTLNLMGQAFQQAFADRAKFLADPDFVKVPVAQLTSDEYLEKKVNEFKPTRARKMDEVFAGSFDGKESDDTSHFSIMDAEGNVVVSTQSINGLFGSRIFAQDSGFALNNGMDDFSQKAGVLNMFGAVGSEKNLPEPNKRPLSSMSPTLILKDGKPILALGCPNGTRIISGIAQVILNQLYFGMDLFSAVQAPRIHHQWQPDQFWLEENTSISPLKPALEKLGYSVKPFKAANFIQAVSLDHGNLISVSDPRDVPGALAE